MVTSKFYSKKVQNFRISENFYSHMIPYQKLAQFWNFETFTHCVGVDYWNVLFYVGDFPIKYFVNISAHTIRRWPKISILCLFLISNHTIMDFLWNSKIFQFLDKSLNCTNRIFDGRISTCNFSLQIKYKYYPRIDVNFELPSHCVGGHFWDTNISTRWMCRWLKISPLILFLTQNHSMVDLFWNSKILPFSE